MILSIVLEYMDTNTLERMATINEKIAAEYKKRINKTVYTDKLIDRTETIEKIGAYFEKKESVLAFSVFNTLYNESILILFNETNNLVLYDMQTNTFCFKEKQVFSNEGEYVASVNYLYNTIIKVHYLILCSNRKSIIIYEYCREFILKRINEIENANSMKRQYFNASTFSFQIFSNNYFSMINTNLEIKSFEGKTILSKSVCLGSNHINGFLSMKDNHKYLYTYFSKGIASYKIIENKTLTEAKLFSVVPYKTYPSFKNHTNCVHYFYSSKNNEDYLLDSDLSTIVIWNLHEGKSIRKIEISIIDGIFSMAKWNSNIVYLTTISMKLYQVNIDKCEEEKVLSPISFNDLTLIAPLTIHQPSLVSMSSNGSMQVLTYSIV